MGSLSNSETNCIVDFIEYGVDKFGFNTGRALPLTLVFLGERDGCLVGGSDTEDVEFLRELFEEYAVPYVEDSSNDAFYVAKSRSHLSQYDPLGSDEEVGKFLGYPQEAIDFYVSNDDRVDEFTEFLSGGASISESNWGDKSFLIEYVPCPSEEGIARALERQEQYERALSSVSVDLSAAHNWEF